MRRPARTPDQLLDAQLSSTQAGLIRNGLAQILEDIWDEKRKAMVSAYRRGAATPELLLGLTAQLAMVEELVDRLDRIVRRGSEARKEIVQDAR